MLFENTAFETLDWIVLAAYFVMLAVSGYLINRRQSSTEDYFLGGRSMPAWAVSISVVATSLSAATFVGGPQQAYKGDLSYLCANLGGILAVLIVAKFFIPAYYNKNVATVYELLEDRFGQPSKLAASWMFMVGRVFASGARIFMASLPASLIMFGDIEPEHMYVAIAVLVAVGIGYTLVGGIASVIWTDVIQMFVFVGAAVIAIGFLLHRIPAGLGEIMSTLQTAGEGETSKLTIFRSGLNFGDEGYFTQAYTVVTAITGFMLFNIAAYGTDQDLTQRMLTCKSAVRGGWSAISAIIVAIPITLLFMSIGLLLYIFYQVDGIMGEAAPNYDVSDSRRIFLTFVLKEIPAGLTGIMMAGLFAAGLSSLNSAINAMSSAFVNDFYKQVRPDGSEGHYLLIGRVAVVVWGVILGTFAGICVHWQKGSGQTLIDFALAVMVFAYGGLLGVYLTALFTNRGNDVSVIAALIIGFLSVVAMQPYGFAYIAQAMDWRDEAGELVKLSIAFPWKMCLATGLSFVVCCIGARPNQEDAT